MMREIMSFSSKMLSIWLSLSPSMLLWRMLNIWNTMGMECVIKNKMAYASAWMNMTLVFWIDLIEFCCALVFLRLPTRCNCGFHPRRLLPSLRLRALFNSRSIFAALQIIKVKPSKIEDKRRSCETIKKNLVNGPSSTTHHGSEYPVVLILPKATSGQTEANSSRISGTTWKNGSQYLPIFSSFILNAIANV